MLEPVLNPEQEFPLVIFAIYVLLGRLTFSLCPVATTGSEKKTPQSGSPLLKSPLGSFVCIPVLQAYPTL